MLARFNWSALDFVKFNKIDDFSNAILAVFWKFENVSSKFQVKQELSYESENA